MTKSNTSSIYNKYSFINLNKKEQGSLPRSLLSYINIMSEFFEYLVAVLTGQCKEDNKEDQQDKDEDNKGSEQ